MKRMKSCTTSSGDVVPVYWLDIPSLETPWHLTNKVR